MAMMKDVWIILITLECPYSLTSDESNRAMNGIDNRREDREGEREHGKKREKRATSTARTR